MKRQITTVSVLLIVFMLSSCGGGGDGATGGAPQPNGLVLTLTPIASSLPANTLGYPIFSSSPFFTPMNVRVTFPNGSVAPDGTVVNLTTSNIEVGFLSVPDDPETEDVNEFASAWITQNNETVGGIANFFLHSNATPGVVTYTASASSEGRTYFGTLNFTITEGPDPTVRQIQGVAARDSLPVNANNVDFYNGTPFMTEVDIQIRDVFGNLTNPAINASVGFPAATVSISPASSMYFTVNDDPTTAVNEFLTPQQTQGVVEIVNGHGNLFLWSKDVAADVTVSISALEAGSGFELSTSFVMNVVDGGSDPTLPSSISILDSNKALYVNGSGGSTAQNLSVLVKGGNLPVNDPQVNNVRLLIVTDSPNSGERLTGVNVFGATVQGNLINIATANGIATASVQSGTTQNTIIVTATTDKADNNVDNGIQDALTVVSQYVVSDGRLWALELTTPALDALTVNGPQTFDEDGNPIVVDGFPALEYQDGTYSLIVSAIGTDKGGNPALPQTVQFGMINSPLSGYPLNGAGEFVHSSNDGDPQEGGSGFSSASGSFITAAGGVQPNDTLIVLGEESLGNEDLESAVTVSNINSQTSITIMERFNRNDESGSINNDFGILPYAVGRAVDGNIEATAVLNENGLATTRLNYPVSQLGRLAAIYVKAQGTVTNGLVKTVTDVELTAFPGVEGFRGNFSNLIVSPNVIPANVSSAFTVCIVDSARNPMAGRFVSFSYTGTGSGIIDGQTSSGTILNATDANGCITTTARTTGLVDSSDSGFIFTSGDLTCKDNDGENIGICLRVSAAAGGVLNASPSAFATSGQKKIILTLYDGSGNVVEGAAISAECDPISGGSLGVLTGPTITDVDGLSEVVVLAALDGINTSLSGSCTFATSTGSPSVTVSFSGNDICLSPPSPLPPGCNNIPQYSVGGSVSGMTTAGPLVLQNNGTDTVNVTGNTTFNFPIQDTGTAYNVSVLTQPPGQTCTVANASGTVGNTNVSNVTVTCI